MMRVFLLAVPIYKNSLSLTEAETEFLFVVHPVRLFPVSGLSLTLPDKIKVKQG